MPYDAWLIIAPAVRSAYEAGIFGEWKLWPKRRRSIEIQNEDRKKIESIPKLPPLKREKKAKTPKVGRRVKVSDEDYLEALRTSPSICQALTTLGLAPKGKNYERAKRLLGIPLSEKLPRRKGNTLQ
jgi:hypothetical protein